MNLTDVRKVLAVTQGIKVVPLIVHPFLGIGLQKRKQQAINNHREWTRLHLLLRDNLALVQASS